MYEHVSISILSFLIVSGQATRVFAETTVSDPVKAAVEKMHDVDANGQAFTLSIAALGGLGFV